MNGLRIIPSHRDMSYVFDGDEYLGLLLDLHDNGWRVHGTRLGVDGRLIDMEAEFPTLEEAKAWLQDGVES